MSELKLVVTQLKSEIGNKTKNLEKAFEIIKRESEKDKPTVIMFPELYLTSYLVKDLVYKVAETIPGPSTEKIEKFLGDYPETMVVMGMPEISTKHYGIIHNSAAVITSEGVVGVYRKRHMPTFGVFDELRYFKPGPASKPKILRFGGFKIGFVICYDAFFPETIKSFSLVGADIVGVLSAGPVASWPLWGPILRTRAIENTVYIMYSNHIGYMDGLEFFGEARIINPIGQVVKIGEPFKEQVLSHYATHSELYAARQIRPIIKDFNYEDALMLLKSYEDHIERGYPTRSE